jgi:zinc transporter ZupT
MFLYTFLSALLIMLTSLIGAIFVWKGFGKLVQHNTHYLITLASGIFTVLVFSLLQETWHLSDSILITVSSVLAGILLIELIIKFIPTAHHHHSVPAKCGHSHSNIDARRMMWSDFFHNAGDGILLVTSYAVDIHIGIAATLGIFLHEAVQEISEFFVLKEAGYSTKKALFWNFLSSSGILIGIILALSVSSVDWLSAPLMGIAGGGFIYALLKDLIPHTLHHAKKTNTALTHLIIFIIGLLLMLAVGNLTPHSHENHTNHEQHIIKN